MSNHFNHLHEKGFKREARELPKNSFENTEFNGLLFLCCQSVFLKAYWLSYAILSCSKRSLFPLSV